jgi:uncharacterized membrane protein YecN with MAPEG domain
VTYALHVTLLYAGFLGLFLIVLSFNMVKSWGRDGRPQKNSPEAVRATALVTSFTDFVPMALILMAGAELMGVSASILHVLGAALVSARVMHAFGSNFTRGSGALRFLGAQITYFVIALLSFGCLFIFAMPELIGLDLRP